MVVAPSHQRRSTHGGIASGDPGSIEHRGREYAAITTDYAALVGPEHTVGVRLLSEAHRRRSQTSGE